jgi:hypothetical protein
MFQAGNKYGKGRPKLSLTKPELLLPLVFQRRGINWASDFCRLYKQWKSKGLNKEEARNFATYLQLMPYLCTKVQLKEIEDKEASAIIQKGANADQTARLLKALENESNGPDSKV